MLCVLVSSGLKVYDECVCFVANFSTTALLWCCVIINNRDVVCVSEERTKKKKTCVEFTRKKAVSTRHQLFKKKKKKKKKKNHLSLESSPKAHVVNVFFCSTKQNQNNGPTYVCLHRNTLHNQPLLFETTEECNVFKQGKKK